MIQPNIITIQPDIIKHSLIAHISIPTKLRGSDGPMAGPFEDWVATVIPLPCAISSPERLDIEPVPCICRTPLY